MPALPIDALLPRIRAELDQNDRLLLNASPGSGKTTGVPPALLDCDWLAGQKIVMLEPRRLATRAAALRMAELRGEPVGNTVGYRMRLDRRVGPDTRIEVLTEGLFTRQLQHDPELRGIGLLIFDEFHERSLDADLGLALALDVQSALRPDLKILVMSATLDDSRIAALLGAQVIKADNRGFPVEVEYLPGARQESLPTHLSRAVRHALGRAQGDVLVFLPGMREIRQAQRSLASIRDSESLEILPLHGSLPRATQLRALEPAHPQRRRLILSTAVAETSLTIDGVDCVVDAGLDRRARYDPRSGLTRLETVRAARSNAEQRRGRAGRTRPGLCLRLWAESEQQGRPQHAEAEIARADLLPLALELAAWGIGDPTRLTWLDQPDPTNWNAAIAQLQLLSAIDATGLITAHGRSMLTLGVHPRLAHMLLLNMDRAEAFTACWVASLLDDQDALQRGPGDSRTVDITERLADRVADGGEGSPRRLKVATKRLAKLLKVKDASIDRASVGPLIAQAYPERVAARRGSERGRFRMRTGRGATVDPADSLAGADYLAIAELDDRGPEPRVLAAASCTPAQIRNRFEDQFESVDSVYWDAQQSAVEARRQVRLGQLIVNDQRLQTPPPGQVLEAMLSGIRELGLRCLPWSDRLRQWQARVEMARALDLIEPRLAACDDTSLLAEMETWLAPWLEGCSRRSHLQNIDLQAALHSRLDWQQQRALKHLLPENLQLPSGSKIPIDYRCGDRPLLSVRLQEMFGTSETPTIADGRFPLLLQLLSPARRPLQRTSDLASFWANAYESVRKEMRGRYPKHDWPENPAEATQSRSARRRDRS